MHKLLVDTCVWLDLAKEPDSAKILDIIEELIRINELSLIVPQTVLDEFSRNKGRIIKESGKSLSGILKRAKEIVDKFGDRESKQTVLDRLDDIDYKIFELGESVAHTIARTEKVLNSSNIIDTSDSIKLRAAQRAITKKAPFHSGRNSFNDAILIEIYTDCVMNEPSAKVEFAFITHNTSDFSISNGNHKIPHPDFEPVFSGINSSYFIKLTESIQKIRPELVSDLMLKNEWFEEPRHLSEIAEVINELTDKIWYNRHQNWLFHIKTGEHRIVAKKEAGQYDPNTTLRDIYISARKAAKAKEKQYGKKNLGPWNDFEWGMLNGKLSALRWVLGDEWDFLDT